MSIFFDFVRTSLLRSKKHYFLSRISKNVSFWLFLLKKKYITKRSIFWQKPWTNPFAKCRFFLTLQELHFSGLKSILYYPEYEKMFLFGLFWLKKKHMKKSSICWQKQWTNPFTKCRFFFTSWELNFWGPKSCIFYPGYKKMFLSGFFCYKKKHIRKNSMFWQKPWTNPLQNVGFLHF